MSDALAVLTRLHRAVLIHELARHDGDEWPAAFREFTEAMKAAGAVIQAHKAQETTGSSRRRQTNAHR